VGIAPIQKRPVSQLPRDDSWQFHLPVEALLAQPKASGEQQSLVLAVLALFGRCSLASLLHGKIPPETYLRLS
jgi:hypothetical protein